MREQEVRNLWEAYLEVCENQQLDEISQKTAITAYARRSSNEFEGDDGPDRVRKNNELHGRIVKKFGDKSGEDANKAADANTFGRTDSRTGKRQERPKSRIEKNRTYRTTKAGKMHGQDQAKLKSDLEKRRNVNDSYEYDTFDTILEHLVSEGYADTNESALAIMANMSEEWRESILDEEKKELPQTKMYRKAGELARSGIATGDEGKKKRSAKIVSAITRETERKRFDEIGKSPKHN
jgi:hypothetical protein